MKKRSLLMPLLTGLMVGQIFAEGERPFSLINTVRFGYNDNLYRNDSNINSFFVNDIVDLSFRAAISDRTDLTAKSQFKFSNDTGGSEVYPNLYLLLNHSVSPRLLLTLSEYYRSGEKAITGLNQAGLKDDVRYTYFYNKVGGSADYVLTGKDHLNVALDQAIERNESKVDTLDWTTIEAVASWKRAIILQRTYSTVNLGRRRTTYDNRDSSFDATDLSVGLNHTFNQNWQGSFEGGVTQVSPDYPAPAKNKDTTSPLVRAGLVYSPSPRTRFTGDLSQQFAESQANSHSGQTLTELSLGVQHDITAKLMAKATARFAKSEYATSDDETATNASGEENRMDLGLRLTYRLNRINFLELGVSHSEKHSEGKNTVGSISDDWKQNMVDVGWRVELK